jgi:hypothetical protein
MDSSNVMRRNGQTITTHKGWKISEKLVASTIRQLGTKTQRQNIGLSKVDWSSKAGGERHFLFIDAAKPDRHRGADICKLVRRPVYGTRRAEFTHLSHASYQVLLSLRSGFNFPSWTQQCYTPRFILERSIWLCSKVRGSRETLSTIWSRSCP